MDGSEGIFRSSESIAKGSVFQRSADKEVFKIFKMRLRNRLGYVAFLFLSYFILSATAVVTAALKR